MPLEEYRRKRKFTQTTEPRGKRGRPAPAPIFVVQHHLASHEHDDFRLELDGVLKSWAVPRRVSLKPGERRLAVQVEDHPLEYATFEGTIPAGNYGAGTVELWDGGVWKPEGDPHAGLAEGKLSFALEGRRLRGRWTLVRTKGDDPRAAKQNWLLIKRSDSARASSRQ